MSAAHQSSDAILVVDHVSKVIGGEEPPTWFGRFVERMNARADGLDEEAWEEGLDDDADVGGLPKGLVASDVSFVVQRGEGLALVGDPHRAVSALMRVLGGISPVTSGVVRVDGRIVYVSDSLARLFGRDGSVRESVLTLGALLRIPTRVTRPALDEILAFASLEGQEKRPLTALRPQDRIRLAIAAALHSDADVFLLDMAAKYVRGTFDPFFSHDLLRFLGDRRAEGRAVVVNAGDVLEECADLCERALLLVDGTLTASGTLREVDRARAALRGEEAMDLSPPAGPPASAVWRTVGVTDEESQSLESPRIPSATQPFVRLLSPSAAPRGSAFVVEVRLDPAEGAEVESVRFAVTVSDGSRTMRFIQPVYQSGAGVARAAVTVDGMTENYCKLVVVGAAETQNVQGRVRRHVGSAMKFGVAMVDHRVEPAPSPGAGASK